MNSSDAIDASVRDAVAGGVFPGASLLVASKGEVLHRGFYGHATLLPSPEPATEQTLWDIASLTKPVATAALARMAIGEEGLSLDSRAARYLPALDSEEKGRITIRHLLEHTSGLPAWKPYFKTIARDFPADLGKRSSRDHYLRLIATDPLEAPVSSKKIYSDLGYILLGILLEDLSSKPLDVLFRERIAEPTGLKKTFYVPVGTGLTRPSAHFAATEKSEWRKKLIRGEVHDDNAYALGGVAGHAGLFSHIDDLHRFLLSVRQGFDRAKANDLKLGWDSPEPKKSQAGTHFSKNSIGHLGFSGCSMWMDLDQDFHVILLTNRVHPSPKNEAIKPFRPLLHDLIYDKFIGN